MKVAVVGDTHGYLNSILRELKSLPGIDLLLHTGDYYRDGLALGKDLKLKNHTVVGNCDLGVNKNKELLLTLKGKRILLTHGHLYGVKQSLNNISLRAKELNADMVIYGHTHVPYLEKIGGLWFMNPGSPSSPRIKSKPTYGFFEIANGEIIPRIIELTPRKK